jgi:7-cyano-7-deazaguanine reductase|tara:strand:+ start:312 stop:1235 length:924 start_codon:yes stop_codon:yes gene_type:complete
MNDQTKNQEKVVEIAGYHLGKVGGAGYSDQYNPDLLVAIPRKYNREAYEIKEDNLPFVGSDVWNCYEVSAITTKGRPVAGMMKIVYPSDSPLHVESKSIKLYLNSFNMTKMGNTEKECIALMEQKVEKDLSVSLKTNVKAKLFTSSNAPEFDMNKQGFIYLDALVDLDEVEFNVFKSDASQLKGADDVVTDEVIKISSNLLRSNCRVTNQPDWGDVYIHMEGTNTPDYESIARYIVSHRQVSHFHEEIVEMVFTHLTQAYKPNKLMVAALYTRRGGLDINPIRATHQDMIPEAFTSTEYINRKTLRQ